MKEKEIERLKNLKEFENNLHSTGLKYIAGIDEAGRGPLAGPVVVGIAIMKPFILYFMLEENLVVEDIKFLVVFMELVLQ